MRHIILLAFAVVFFPVGAQDIIWRSSRQVGAGNIISLPGTGDVMSFNPSVHVSEKGVSGQLGYTLPFNIEAFRQQFANALWGGSIGYIGVAAGINGDDNSAVRRVGMQYSRNFGTGWRAGLGYYVVQHHFVSKQNFSSSFSVAGVSYRNSKSGVTVSVVIQNFEQQSIEYPTHSVNIPSVVVAGLQWEAAKGLFLMAETEKDFDREPDFKGAVVYELGSMVLLSVGACGPELQLSAGAGVYLRGVKLHVGIAHHRELGVTSAATLSISGLFRKNKEG